MPFSSVTLGHWTFQSGLIFFPASDKSDGKSDYGLILFYIKDNCNEGGIQL